MSAARPYLRLVRNLSKDEREAPLQFELAPDPSFAATDNVIGVCTADSLDEAVLQDLVRKIRPTHIVDFRTVPRFDFGSFSRAKAFSLFSECDANYIDIGKGPLQSRDELIHALKELTALKSAKSLLILINASADFEKIGFAFTQELRQLSGKSWELLLCGPAERPVGKRKLVFISHGNPEDNEFVVWLQAQLTRLGYETWSDLNSLKAGEVFWDTIEKTIRHETIRFIAVISKNSMAKPGVLDEISLAISVERTQQLSGFVIPIRLDDVPYDQFRANIARKKVLDFSVSWSTALAELTRNLADDNIPRVAIEQGLSLRVWWERQKPTKNSITRSPERLISNRFSVQKLPDKVYSYSVDFGAEDPFSFNGVPFGNLWLSFLDINDLRGGAFVLLRQESSLSAREFFDGNVGITEHLSPEARQRLLHRMLNKCWEVYLLKQGLKLYTLTGRRPVPFIPDDLISKNSVTFNDPEAGASRRRVLVGFSQKRALYWHLAPLGSFTTAGELMLALKLRVLFSEDGSVKWPSADRMRLARRSFCKNWWNDRWRSLQLALMFWLSGGKHEIDLLGNQSLLVSASPVSYTSPISIVEDADEETNYSKDVEDPEDPDIDDHAESDIGGDGASV